MWNSTDFLWSQTAIVGRGVIGMTKPSAIMFLSIQVVPTQFHHGSFKQPKFCDPQMEQRKRHENFTIEVIDVAHPEVYLIYHHAVY
ncbi:MAG: hypothetical protein IPK94_05780 [Saprospiraceae bacterium]|nr:hypothetical protein [Saprospiraceae bacterium]